MKLCFATNNSHKLDEIRQMIGDRHQIVSLADLGHHEDIPEDFDTMEENSLQKASFIHSKYGINCFADDSGLEVDALDGAPGVFSARFAGPQRNDADNNSKLLATLEGVENRNARFRAVISLILNNGSYQFEGVVRGTLGTGLQGQGGFGYDPLFIPEGYDITFAEMNEVEKNQLSHRGRAVQKLVEFLSNLK